MFRNIICPVDLAHEDKLDRALECAAGLAKLYDAPVTYLAISSKVPSKVAHTPAEFEAKLAAFASEQGVRHGITTHAEARFSNDPTSDLENTILKAVKESGADLVVMATHAPGITDWIWPSHGGTIAEWATASVMVVRE